MNWLHKISEQADQMVGTLDATLQQTVTDAMVFRPLHQHDISETHALASAAPENMSEPCTDPCAPSGGEPVHQEAARPSYAARLKPA